MSAESGSPFTTILDTRIDNLAMDEALERIAALAESPAFSHVITANVDQLMKKRGEPGLAEVYRRAALVVADGMPLLWAARFLGTPLRERINGTDLMERACGFAAARNFPVFLLGSQAGDGERAADRLRERFPGLAVSGIYAPYHGFENDARENAKIQAMIAAKRPAILFVSLGSPKGLKWIDRHQRDCGAAVAVEVGASFAFLSGRIRRAPRWMQNAGLEWAWRLVHEPLRLGKRYLADLPFFYFVLKQKLSAGKPRRA